MLLEQAHQFLTGVAGGPGNSCGEWPWVGRQGSRCVGVLHGYLSLAQARPQPSQRL